LINDVERENAVWLVRARQGKQTIFTGSRVNGPGQDDLARKVVFATRAKSSRASINNDNGMQGGLCHEGTVIAGKLLCLRSKPTAVTANEGTDIAGELNFLFCFCQQANSGHGQRGHRHCGRATYFFVFVSRPTAVMANEGTDIAGELLFFSQQAKWRSRHKGFDITSKLTVCTASPSGLGQQGHKASRASCI
jgi:hypothetical protein